MTDAQQPGAFRKSSYSSGDNDCVEVADSARVAWVRDTKDRSGGTLKMSRPSFDAFQRAIVEGVAAE